MKKRYIVLGLSLVLALALSVPALGGPSNPIASVSASVKSIANKALKKAKTAQTTAESAQSTANSASSAAADAQKDAAAAQKTGTAAQGTANTALTTANAAKAAAATAQTAANGAKATADAAQATANSKMSGEVQVEGEAGTTFGIAGCPSGKVPTGGGFIITGANNNSATVTESTQYGSAWIVFAEQINGVAGTSWGTVATVNCATSP
jgi:membrane protein involved in colicin uptake